jgi:DNA-binding NtrC family response regulator
MTEIPQGLSVLIGYGPRMQAVRDFLLMNAGDTTPVVIVGEPGTGRRFVARLLRDLSPLAPGGQRVSRSITIGDEHDLPPRQSLRLALPALRNRLEDVPMLTDHFLALELAAVGAAAKRVTPSACQALQSYAWPGNVRELQRLCGWLAHACVCGSVKRSCLPPRFQHGLAVDSEPAAPAGTSLTAQLRTLEERLILDALRQSGFNRSRAARLLGIKRSTLGDRIDRLGFAQRLTEEVA